MMDPPPPLPPPPPAAAIATAAETTPPEITDEFRKAVTAAATRLEAARCHETELQAWTLFATSQLSLQSSQTAGSSSSASTTTIDTEAFPGSVADAWSAVAKAAAKPVEEGLQQQAEAAASSSQKDKVSGTGSRSIDIPPGQQAAAVRTICTANSLKCMAVMAETVLQDRKDTAALWKQQFQPQLVASSSSSSNTANPTQWWLQALDERLQEIRTYHAEHQAASAAAAPSSAAERNNHKHDRWGNPVADGYDLAATVQQWTSKMDTEYTVDEVLGKYLDLQTSYQAILYSQLIASQLRGSATDGTTTTTNNNSSLFQYVDFLEDLAKGIGLVWKEQVKLLKRKKYLRWLIQLETYLLSFLQRTVPLLDSSEIVANAEKEFHDTWSQTGGFTGWKSVAAEAVLATTNNNTTTTTTTTNTNTSSDTPKIDLTAYETAEQLAAQIDGDQLKAQLALLGLKCGGTVLDRAKRLFLLKDRKLEDLPSKVFAKHKQTAVALPAAAEASTRDVEESVTPAATTTGDNPIAPAAGGTTTATTTDTRRIDIARREAVVTALLDQVRPTLEATIRRTERRQTQTLKERDREIEQELYGAGVVVREKKARTAGDGEGGDNNNEDDDVSDSDDEDAPIYNPKNVPLDWDGKPIPYWLFKLHGLNHYYECEICGGESYRGRRNFELHFAEQRHASGMRSLGIPNTKHFHGVTKIEDAQELWKSLEDKLNQGQFDGTREEEYEDSSGNVLSRKTYEDLARQGLL